MPEPSFKTFLRGGRSLGLPLGLIYAFGSTVQRYGLSTDALLSIDFLILLVVAASVGFILAGAWELLLEVTLRGYKYKSALKDEPINSLKVILVEGGVRFGLPLGFTLAVAKTFGQYGLSADPILWLRFLSSLCFELLVFFLIGCVFGVFILGALKVLGPPDGQSTR